MTRGFNIATDLSTTSFTSAPVLLLLAGVLLAGGCRESNSLSAPFCTSQMPLLIDAKVPRTVESIENE